MFAQVAWVLLVFTQVKLVFLYVECKICEAKQYISHLNYVIKAFCARFIEFITSYLPVQEVSECRTKAPPPLRRKASAHPPYKPILLFS